MSKPELVFLDARPLNPGDLDWSPLAALGNLTIYDHTPAHEVVSRSVHADVLLVNKVKFTAETLDQLPRLRCIVVTATGYNMIDIEAAKQRGIIVCNAVGYGPNAVAQHAFALLLHLVNHVYEYADSVQRGVWSAQPDFCYLLQPITALNGLTLGLVGLGKIGSRVAAIAKGFGMTVQAVRGNPDKTPEPGVELVSIEQLFSSSDVVCLTAPLTPKTKGIVNANTLALMKKTAYLINVARGELVVEADLKAALLENRIAAAGLDVLDGEPPRPNHPLFGIQNCIITPHVAWLATAARQRLMDITVSNVQGFLSGQPINVVW
jgi:glycerate dehydrogenase